MLIFICREKVFIPSTKPYISFIGTQNRTSDTVISWNNKASDKGNDGKELGTYNSASVAIESDYFCATGITFEVRRASFVLLLRHLYIPFPNMGSYHEEKTKYDVTKRKRKEKKPNMKAWNLKAMMMVWIINLLILHVVFCGCRTL